jgi:hypothetical protein
MGKRKMKGGCEDEAKGNQSFDGYFHSDISLVVEKVLMRMVLNIPLNENDSQIEKMTEL